jgi:putative PIN family toxin of toxin-antitoxin system
VVIDTNVLVSALLSKYSDSATVQVVSKIFSGEITPLFSKHILEEYYEVLHRKKFNFSEKQIDILLTGIDTYGVCINPSPSRETLPDLKDLPFYEAVLEKYQEGTYLVTGNIKHFPVKSFIVTAGELIELLDKS